MALIARQFIDAVVAIGTRGSDGGPQWMATGFIFFIPMEPQPSPQKVHRCYLVTNRHVLQDQRAIVLRFNPSTPANPVDFDVELNDQLGPVWAPHPDPDVDVASMGFNVNVLEQQGLNFGYVTSENAFTLEQMKEAGVFEGDSVYIIGFPMGLNTPAMQYAIVRFGCIARVRDAYDAKRGPFLVDASVFPGNSGGPVFLRPEGAALLGTKAIAASMLVGLVHAYVPYIDAAISQQTGRPRVIFEENSGLARVESVDRILEACAAAQVAWDLRTTQQSPSPQSQDEAQSGAATTASAAAPDSK
jgi:S1-C subfamily serine protease